MSDNKEYNGWSNYATWRVHLEMFDGQTDCRGQYDAYKLGLILREETEEVTQFECKGLGLDLAMAFLADVNWTEIAAHLIPEDEGMVLEDTEEDLRGEQA